MRGMQCVGVLAPIWMGKANSGVRCDYVSAKNNTRIYMALMENVSTLSRSV